MVFVRPPSAPELRVNEEAQVPKAKGWDALLANTSSVGVHADDLPQAQNLTLPEWSHLNRKCATVFTDAYVRRLAGTDAAPQAAPRCAAAAVPRRLRLESSGGPLPGHGLIKTAARRRHISKSAVFLLSPMLAPRSSWISLLIL